MNNYEQSRVVELGPASDIIRGAKLWAPYMIDSQLYLETIDLYAMDIDETDD